MPVLQEGGMIGDITAEPEPARPPVGADTEAVRPLVHSGLLLGDKRAFISEMN